MSEQGRYTLTVTYYEKNPNYVPLPDMNSSWGYQERDKREPHQVNYENVTVLQADLTPEQFHALKAETLKVWCR